MVSAARAWAIADVARTRAGRTSDLFIAGLLRQGDHQGLVVAHAPKTMAATGRAGGHAAVAVVQVALLFFLRLVEGRSLGGRDRVERRSRRRPAAETLVASG